METLFRKYFWAINLLFLLIAAFLAAKTANTFVAGALLPVPDLNAPAAGPALNQGPQKTGLSAEALSAVTGIPLPKPEPEVVEPTQPTQPPIDSQEAVKTSLRVRLIGTLVANRPEWSMANIEDVASHEVNVYMVGDKVQSAEVIEIERLRVLINNNGRKEYIDAEPGTGMVVAAEAPRHEAVAANTNPPAGPSMGQGIRALNDNNYEIEKGEIDKALGNLNDIAMQARIVPAFKDGVSTGFKLFSIRPDSLYTKIGIQNGDVISRINGFEMNSPDKALEIYSKLKESNRIEIEIDRNGTKVRKTYNVTGR